MSFNKRKSLIRRILNEYLMCVFFVILLLRFPPFLCWSLCLSCSLDLVEWYVLFFKHVHQILHSSSHLVRRIFNPLTHRFFAKDWKYIDANIWWEHETICKPANLDFLFPYGSIIMKFDQIAKSSDSFYLKSVSFC